MLKNLAPFYYFTIAEAPRFYLLGISAFLFFAFEYKHPRSVTKYFSYCLPCFAFMACRQLRQLTTDRIMDILGEYDLILQSMHTSIEKLPQVYRFNNTARCKKEKMF